MSENIKSMLLVLVAAGVGWLFSEFSQFLRGYREKRKILKKTLFFLLETLFVIKKISLDSFKELANLHMPESTMKEIEQDPIGRQLLVELDSIVRGLLYSRYKPHVLKLEERFIPTIESLSEVDPFSAYRLAGEPNIFKAFDSIKEYKNLLGENENLTFISDEINKLSDFTDPLVIDTSNKVILREIKIISRKIGPCTYLKTKKLIEGGSKNSSEDYKLVEDFIVKFKAKLSEDDFELK